MCRCLEELLACNTFITCACSLEVWQSCGLWNKIDPFLLNKDSVQDLVLKLYDSLNEDQFKLCHDFMELYD